MNIYVSSALILYNFMQKKNSTPFNSVYAGVAKPIFLL
jgi:hypothetical protein